MEPIKSKELQKLFEEFLTKYNVENHKAIWNKQSETFRQFWADKILDAKCSTIPKAQLDSIICILDAKAKGHREFREAGGEEVARTNITQGRWYRMFEDFKDKSDIQEIMNAIFNATNDEQRINLIDQLEKANEKNRNGLTGGRACALNALLFAYHPERYLSMVSLKHRLKVIKYLDLGDPESYESLSYGERIIWTNRDILSRFKEKYDIEATPRALTRFLYSDSIWPIWWKDEIEEEGAKKEIKRKIENIEIEPKDVQEFINSVKLDHLKYEPYFLKPPDRIKIRSIIENCSSGKWVLPHFQRYFDWKQKDVKDFFESILSGYYVGAFLLWNTEKNPPLGIMPIMGIPLEREDLRPESIILDGQQRITSLYYAIKIPGFSLKGDSRGPVYFYVDINSLLTPVKEKEVIVVLPNQLDEEESYKRFLFPLYKLEEHDEWVDGYEDFILARSADQNKIRQIRRLIAKRLEYVWEGFEIPYISLPSNMELVQATEIFERLNTRGITLSVFDLLIARMYKYDVGLRDLWDGTLQGYPNIERYHKKINKIPIYILQAMALCFSSAGSCKRKDILDIYENVYEGTDFSFEEHWKELSDYLNISIEILENLRVDGFGVKNEKEMPFESMIPVLTSLLKEIDSREKKADCYKKLRMWYWASVFSNAYSQAADTRMTSDFKEMKAWFSDDAKIPDSLIKARRMLPYLNLKEEQYKSSAAYRGVMSILAIEGAKDFETGRSLENARSNDKDHIYPKGLFKPLGGQIDSVLNMTWMSDDTNRRIKRCKKPSEYLKEFINKTYGGSEREFLKILETHFINKKAYEFLLKDERGFDTFLDERQRVIMSKVGELVGVESLETEPGLITPEEPFKNKAMFGEVIQSCEEYLYWADKYFSIQGLKLLSQFLNKDKVKELKILTSADKTDNNFRDLFKDFKSEMKNKGVICDCRVIIDPKLKSQIHDRWIISKDQCFNIPSPDTVARGQYSEIKKTENMPPFEEWWQNSKDIIAEWDTIKNFIR